jgi:hypothetical protein
MPKLNIQLPKGLETQPKEVREAVLETMRQALKLPKELPVTHSGGNEHNMWERNHDDLLADAEDDFYEYLQAPSTQRMADVFLALELTTDGIDMEKAFSMAWSAYSDELMKSPNKRQAKKNAKHLFSDLINAGKAKADQFLKYLQDGAPMTKKEISALNKLLKAKLPEYADKVEAFMTRAGGIGKIRNEAEKQNLQMVGMLVDRFPETIQAARRESLVLTTKEKAAKLPKRTTVMPLTPQESRAVEHATHSAASKITEVTARHIDGIKQLVLRAQKERWSVAKLQQALFDMYGEQNRDWRRVAITELSMATNDAYLSGLEEGESVVGMGSQDACKHCKQYVIGKDFTVMGEAPSEDTYSTDMKHVWAGKSNYGRRVSEYVPAIPMHPNCRCRWHRVSRFYKVPEGGGKPKLKESWELIQEERLKRGMGLDPNLPTPYSMRTSEG